MVFCAFSFSNVFMNSLRHFSLCCLLPKHSNSPRTVRYSAAAFNFPIQTVFQSHFQIRGFRKRGLRTASPNAMPHAVENPFVDPPVPRKLVLCFDGTGNQFMGNTSDTNIVKLYDKLDRKNPNQYHYYQSKPRLSLILEMFFAHSIGQLALAPMTSVVVP